jgi:hypothetical protein
VRGGYGRLPRRKFLIRGAGEAAARQDHRGRIKTPSRMGIIIDVALVALSSWGVRSTFRSLRQSHAGRPWWSAFVALTIVGVLAGSWLALRFEYQVSPKIHFFSFPIPIVFFHLEQGQWIDFVPTAPVMYLGVITNILAVVSGFLLPLLLASTLFHRRKRGETHGPWTSRR